jgi:hypothetical protein
VVRARISWIACLRSSGAVWAPPRTPDAPASETVATSSGPLAPAIPAWMIGKRTPSTSAAHPGAVGGGVGGASTRTPRRKESSTRRCAIHRPITSATPSASDQMLGR